MKNTIKCLCGECEFTVQLEKPEIGACHCSMCQQWAAGLYMAAHLETSVDFEPIEKAKVFESSDWGRRVFCQDCGTALAWQMADKSFTAVSAGALVNKADLKFTEEIFVDEKMPCYNLQPGSVKKTAAQVMAEFGA